MSDIEVKEGDNRRLGEVLKIHRIDPFSNLGCVFTSVKKKKKKLQEFSGAFKLNSLRKPELTRPLVIFPVQITKNKANPKR